jgi:hypothetical protein
VQVGLPLPREFGEDFRMDVHDVIDGTAGRSAHASVRLPFVPTTGPYLELRAAFGGLRLSIV